MRDVQSRIIHWISLTRARMSLALFLHFLFRSGLVSVGPGDWLLS